MLAGRLICHVVQLVMRLIVSTYTSIPIDKYLYNLAGAADRPVGRDWGDTGVLL